MKKIFISLIIMILSSAQITFAQGNTEAMLQYNQGIDYYKIGQYNEAIGCFRSAIKLDPNYIDAYYNLGSVLEYLQQYDAALTVFKQVIVRKPDDYDSVYKAAWLSYKTGSAQKAKTYLTLIPPESARYQDAKALASKLNFSISQNNAKQAIQPKKAFIQSSGMYSNIPAPTGITSDNEGNLYVAEFNTNSIVKITPDDKHIIYLKDPKISGPIGIASDASKNLYIANYNKNNILKVSPFGEITVLISNVKKPYCLYVSGNMLFVSCQGSNSVLRYKLDK